MTPHPIFLKTYCGGIIDELVAFHQFFWSVLQEADIGEHKLLELGTQSCHFVIFSVVDKNLCNAPGKLIFWNMREKIEKLKAIANWSPETM